MCHLFHDLLPLLHDQVECMLEPGRWTDGNMDGVGRKEKERGQRVVRKIERQIQMHRQI